MVNLGQKRLLKELDLLSGVGTGVAAIAPSVAALVRQIVGAQACVIVWVGDTGAPEGVFHEGGSLATMELFTNEYARLFAGDKEPNITWLAQQKGAVVGKLLRPNAAYFRSNSFNLLLRPDGFHHVLDLRIEQEGLTRAVVSLLRPQSQAFSDADAQKLLALLPVLQRAVRKTVSPDAAQTGSVRTGHMLLSAHGAHIDLVNDEGLALLRECNLMGQGIVLQQPMAMPPLFIQKLCQELAASGKARTEIDVSGGQMVCVAVPMNQAEVLGHPSVERRSPFDFNSQSILITIELRQPHAAQIVRSVLDLNLSPLQSRIALFAAQGGSRIRCAQQHQVNKDTLKKHMRQIYDAAECENWDALATKLKSGHIGLS